MGFLIAFCYLGVLYGAGWLIANDLSYGGLLLALWILVIMADGTLGLSATYLEERRYNRERKRFREAIARGEDPPIPILRIGRGWRIDPEDLVQTRSFKKQLEALRRLEESGRLGGLSHNPYDGM